MLRILIFIFVFLFPLVEIVPKSVISIKGITFFNLIASLFIIYSIFLLIYTKNPQLQRGSRANSRYALYFILFFFITEIYSIVFKIIIVGDLFLLAAMLKNLQLLIGVSLLIYWTRVSTISNLIRRILKISLLFISISVIVDFFNPSFFSRFYEVNTFGTGLNLRSAGLFNGHATQLGSYLVIGQAFILNEIHSKSSKVNWIILLLLFFGVILTGTRVALIFSVFIFVFNRFLLSKKGFIFTLFIFFLGVSILLMWGENILFRFSSEFETTEDFIQYNRPAVWGIYINELSENPIIFWLGAIGGVTKTNISTHSVYLNMLIKGGIIMVMIFVIFSIRFFRFLFKNYNINSGLVLAIFSWYMMALINENEIIMITYLIVLFLAINPPRQNIQKITSV
jgi:hypothetical protein